VFPAVVSAAVFLNGPATDVDAAHQAFTGLPSRHRGTCVLDMAVPGDAFATSPPSVPSGGAEPILEAIEPSTTTGAYLGTWLAHMRGRVRPPPTTATPG
jgi:hypothetical protein